VPVGEGGLLCLLQPDMAPAALTGVVAENEMRPFPGKRCRPESMPVST
jgi:hypothetical protein